MQIKIEQFEYDGAKYISCSRVGEDKIVEDSFEYTDTDSVKTILLLLDGKINKIINK